MTTLRLLRPDDFVFLLRQVLKALQQPLCQASPLPRNELQCGRFDFLHAHSRIVPEIRNIADYSREVERYKLSLVRQFARKQRIGYVGSMKADDLITVDPEILGGTPVFKGTRVPVKALFDYLEENYTLEEFLVYFPSVTRDLACRVLERSETALLSAS